MAHSRPCEDALLSKCVCRCGGADHGWPGAIRAAKEESGARRSELRAKADNDWNAARRTTPGKQPTATRKSAATRTAAVDIIDWLAEHPDAVRVTEKIGNIVADTSRSGLDTSLSPAGRIKARKAKDEHFWCDLAVALANSIETLARRADEALSRVPEYAIALMVESRTDDRRSKDVNPLVRLAIYATWKSVKATLIQQVPLDPGSLVKALRILAILICPSPGNHAAVRDGALRPLTKDVISEATKQRLEEVFSEEWLTQIRQSLAG